MSVASHEVGLSEPIRRTAIRLDAILGFSAALFAAALAATALLASPRFFLTDDYATYFMPGFREIALLIQHGQAPLLTDRIWNGGALLQEYQDAGFNPVSLVLYLVISQTNDLAAGAAVYSLTHIAILAGGVYFLCRVLGCLRRHAFLVAVVAPLSDWIFYWGAADWIPALVSLAWLAWAWAFLVLTFKRPRFAPAAAGTTAMLLLSGWPFADFAFLLSVLVAGRLLLTTRPNLRAAAWPALALAAGGLIAMPALLPLEFYVGFTHRPPVEGHWATDLTGLLEFGMPFVHVRWGTFSAAEYETVSYPIVYAAWFAPLALAGANWKRLLANRAVWLVLGSALAFAAVSMISHIGLLRWMFRLLPYYQLAVLVLAAMALTQADEDGESWSFDRMALVVAAEVWLAFGQTRELALTYLAVAYAFGVLAWVSTRFKTRRDVRWTTLAVATSAVVFWLTLWQASTGGWPAYPRSWRLPVVAGKDFAASGPTRFELAHPPSPKSDPGPAFWATFPLGNTTLYASGRTLGGYSPMPTPLFAGLTCVGRLIDRCDDVITNATAKADPTGRSLIDLTGVNEVDIQREADARMFTAAAGAGWSEARGAAGEWRFTRLTPEGLVTWAGPGVQTNVISHALTKIVLAARNDAPVNGPLVIARAWYPDWKASLDGAPVRAHAFEDTLVVVDLPPRSHGLLTVSFWPKGLTAGLILAALGVLLIVAATFFPALIDRPVGQIEEFLARRTRKTSAQAA